MDRNPPPQEAQQPIIIDLLPTGDRCTVAVIFRSTSPIKIADLLPAMVSYAQQSMERLEAAKARKSLILP